MIQSLAHCIHTISQHNKALALNDKPCHCWKTDLIDNFLKYYYLAELCLSWWQAVSVPSFMLCYVQERNQIQIGEKANDHASGRRKEIASKSKVRSQRRVTPAVRGRRDWWGRRTGTKGGTWSIWEDRWGKESAWPGQFWKRIKGTKEGSWSWAGLAEAWGVWGVRRQIPCLRT